MILTNAQVQQILDLDQSGGIRLNKRRKLRNSITTTRKNSSNSKVKPFLLLVRLDQLKELNSAKPTIQASMTLKLSTKSISQKGQEPATQR